MTARRGRVAALAAASILLAPAFPTDRAEAAAQETHLVVVSGLGGEPRFQDEFLTWGQLIFDAGLAAGVRPENATFLAEDPARDPERIRARSTREEVEAAILEIADHAGPEDRVLIVLIGHGAGSGEDSMVSLPGPSLRASDYAALLDPLAPRSVALVNTASASGDFARVLSGENRIVITATRSAGQRNATLFGLHFAEAFAGEGADIDRDGRVSLLEAFEYARRETERHYTDRGLIQSEQALLEDRPSGPGVTRPDEEPEVGGLAARFFLEPERAVTVPEDPEVAARLSELQDRRDQLEAEIDALGERRGELSPEEYQEALEALLVELSRVGQEIREVEGGGP